MRRFRAQPRYDGERRKIGSGRPLRKFCRGCVVARESNLFIFIIIIIIIIIIMIIIIIIIINVIHSRLWWNNLFHLIKSPVRRNYFCYQILSGISGWHSSRKPFFTIFRTAKRLGFPAIRDPAFPRLTTVPVIWWISENPSGYDVTRWRKKWKK